MNRSLIAGANGVIGLSVPLEHGRSQRGSVKQIKISQREKWQARHWKSIQSAYNRSPWFEFYRNDLAVLFETPFLYLSDWNLACLQWTIHQLDLSTSIVLLETWPDWQQDTVPQGEEKVKDLRRQVIPSTYQKMDSLKYTQVFENRLGFIANLSILDLIFCEGNRAAILLKAGTATYGKDYM